MLAPEMDSGLFVELAQSRTQQVGIFGFTPAAGKGPVSRPGVIFPLGAADEQNRLRRFLRVENCDRCFGIGHSLYDPPGAA